MKYMVVGGLVLVILTIAKGLFPDGLSFLPLGGSSIAEMGVVLGLAVVAATLAELRRGNEHGEAQDNGDDRA